MTDRFVLKAEESLLLVIDIQERLAAAMSKREQVTRNVTHLLELARLKDLPVRVTEQYPKGLGHTVSELSDAMSTVQRFEKISFSCCGEPGFMDHLKDPGRSKIVVCGMETHVCVLMTALDLLHEGFVVHVVADAVCSRHDDNWSTALSMLRDAGAVVTSTETVLFQWLERAGSEEFKAISKRIR